MEDVTDEFCKIEIVLTKFYAWRKTDIASYKDAFVSLCLPKVCQYLKHYIECKSAIFVMFY